MTKGGLQGELIEQSRNSLAHLDAAAQNMTPEDRMFLKNGFARLRLLRAAEKNPHVKESPRIQPRRYDRTFPANSKVSGDAPDPFLATRLAAITAPR
jgi:hypothetical protein